MRPNLSSSPRARSDLGLLRALTLCPALLVPALAQAEDQPSNLPLQAGQMLADSTDAQNRLQDDYLQKLIAEQNRLLANLDKVCKSCVRDGNLDGALAVKKAMAAVSDSIQTEKNTIAFSHVTGDDIERMLLATTYTFRYPSGTRVLRFGENGHFREGSNENEGSWRLNGKKLEIVNTSGVLFSRWDCDPATGTWQNEKFGDVLCTDDLTLFPQKADDPHN